MKTKNYLKILLAAFMLIPLLNLAQGVAISDDDSEADPSAMLDIKSTDKGVLFPRLTTQQIIDINNPTPGLIVYNSEENRFYFWEENASSSGIWREIPIGSNAIAPPFTQCGDYLVDSRDNQVYSTVQIGTQCWVAENLNVGSIIYGSSSSNNNGVIEKHCYNDNPANCDTYGGLYHWGEMMDYTTTPGAQGICPTGWHIPTDDEWKTMEMYLGMSLAQADATGLRGTDEGGKLKETGTTHWSSPNTGATNTSGFTSLPGGYQSVASGVFSTLNIGDYQWTSSQSGSSVWRRWIGYDDQRTGRSTITKTYNFSVRCLKN